VWCVPDKTALGGRGGYVHHTEVAGGWGQGKQARAKMVVVEVITVAIYGVFRPGEGLKRMHSFRWKRRQNNIKGKRKMKKNRRNNYGVEMKYSPSEIWLDYWVGGGGRTAVSEARERKSGKQHGHPEARKNNQVVGMSHCV